MTSETLSDVVVARLLREMEGYLELELFDDVCDRAHRLIEAGREVSRALSLKGHALQTAERWIQAIETFDALRAHDPDADTAYFGLGWCLKRTDRLDLAIEALEALLARQPQHPLGNYNLACYLALDGERDRPLDLLRKAIDLDDSYREHAETETDFDAIRDDAAFRAILDQKK